MLAGTEGVIGSILRRHLRSNNDLRLLSRTRMDEPAHVADIADYAAIRPVFEGVDSVVHLAAASAPNSTWEEVLHSNIVGTYNGHTAAWWRFCPGRFVRPTRDEPSASAETDRISLQVNMSSR